MFEIAVSLRQGSQREGEIAGDERNGKMCGDILVAKPVGSSWGLEERRLFLITLLEDPEIQFRLIDDQVISYPYSTERCRSKFRVKVGQKINGIKQPNMFEGSSGLNSREITRYLSEPTTKGSDTTYCTLCKEKHSGNDFCPKCDSLLVEFLELSDLYFDDSPRE